MHILGTISSSKLAQTQYWVSLFGSNTFSEATPFDVKLDSSNNVYVAGMYGTGSNYNIQLVKYNNLGDIQFQSKMTESGGLSAIRGLDLDSSGNIFVVGTRQPSGGDLEIQAIKYNNSGVVQWQKSLTRVGNDEAEACVVDSSGNLVLCGAFYSSGIGNAYVAKLASSDGSTTFQRQMGSANPNDEAWFDVKLDSVSGIALCGYKYENGDYYKLFVTKLNSTGDTVSWQRSIGNFGNTTFGRGVALDSSDSVYVIGNTSVSGNPMFLAKYNSTGTVQWYRKIDAPSFSTLNARSISVSGSDVFVLGTNSNDNSAILAKYNTSGTLQYQRSLKFSNGAFYPESIHVRSNGTMVIVGSTNHLGYYTFATIKLPSDGSLTGSYAIGPGNFSYTASSLTPSDTSFLETSTGYTNSAASLTSTTSSLTFSSTSLAGSIKYI